ncbi:MAG TPA: LacI family DNA-binding transcriptional regulator [Candidatus Binatia bacterium]|nr:LacI family DNA-binding transcriptional regulator [Candidatus Binatia bacterium]
MSKRPTIPDLARAAGVSVATVDRVLNRRLPVREVTVERVLEAAEAIGFHAAGLIRQRLRDGTPSRTFGFLLQGRGDRFYQGFGEELAAATRARSDIRGKPVVEFVDELSPAVIAQRLSDLGARVDALAVVSVDHPHVSLAIERLRARGVPTFAVISDLTADTRAAFIGQDSRKEGRTAAWMIANTASRRTPNGPSPNGQGPNGQGKVGIIVGTHRYLCQETAEISFRSYFREHAPGFRLLESLVNLEDARIAQEATRDLLDRNADLVGLYICGGGMEGVIDAAREARAEGLQHEPVAIVCNELSDKTRDALIDGILTAVISTRTGQIAARTVEAMAAAIGDPAQLAPAQPTQFLVPFDLYIAENV